ncbi:MAG: hypothetical protein IJX46_02315 [Clostridia bacterium]|nr:hypothetical protein [Clostridia bacterium]
MGKFAFEGNNPKSKSDASGYKAKVRLIASGDIFNIVEDGAYVKSEKEKGKTTVAHKDAQYWDYFWKEIFVDGKGYDVVINIRNDSKTGNLDDKTQYVYSMSFTENKKGQPSVTVPASSKQASVNLRAPSANSIPQNQDLSTDKSEIAEKNAQKAVFGSEKADVAEDEIPNSSREYAQMKREEENGSDGDKSIKTWGVKDIQLLRLKADMVKGRKVYCTDEMSQTVSRALRVLTPTLSLI